MKMMRLQMRKFDGYLRHAIESTNENKVNHPDINSLRNKDKPSCGNLQHARPKCTA
jgi:hypothetical protein